MISDTSEDAVNPGNGAGLTLGEFTRKLLALDADAPHSTASEHEQEPVTCRKGCGACCRQLVTVSAAEAFALADLVDWLPESRRLQVEARFAQVEAALGEVARDSIPGDGPTLRDRLLTLDDPALDDEAHYQIARQYFELGIRCPFLGPDEACSIYSDQPWPCREYLVTSPAELCDDPFANEIDRLPVQVSRSEALGSMCARLLRTEVQLIPLSLCMAWVRRHPEDRRRRWDADHLAFNFTLHSEAVSAARTMPTPET